MPPGISPQELVPFRWPESWTEPNLISSFERGPINCIVVDGAPQQISEAARKAGLAVLEAGSLAAVPLAAVNGEGANAMIAIRDLSWPRMKPLANNRRDRAEAGPTGAPWIDSNSWVARLAAARAPGKPIWLVFDPPDKEDAPPEGAYHIAIADAAAAHARWVVSLDDKLSRAIAQRDSGALGTWRSILGTLGFFEKQRAWRSYTHEGPLGIISSFSGEGEFLATELLNLAARRNLLYRIFDRSRALSAELTGLRGVVWADPDPPTAEMAAKLSGFARRGGLLIVPRTAPSSLTGERVLDCPVAGYELRALGRGSIARATREWDDPYFLAADVHSLVGRRHDPIRLFSGSACWVHYTAAANGKESLFQFVNFSWNRILGGMMGTGEISFRITFRHRTVTLHAPGRDPQVLQPVNDGGNIEYHLPQSGPYAALEVKA